MGHTASRALRASVCLTRGREGGERCPAHGRILEILRHSGDANLPEGDAKLLSLAVVLESRVRRGCSPVLEAQNQKRTPATTRVSRSRPL